ncbi:S9 family peptidase [Chryseobacterium sp. cx-311]|uniref:alpha/beta hydrolase family protein n=1 Tax=Marnyiella aurantia TaxID=2758037 RepID=UPI001AE829FF|nr:prolyl oligopeptidase family serine peptidase [Marnyiella aurantia]MBP0613952.1 S9 family peptidase [Marnyiella aurantia]
MKRQILLLLSFFFALTSASWRAGTPADTLKQWTSRYYTLSNTELSENGRWATVRKSYEQRTDTVMVFDTQRKNPLIGSFSGMPQHTLTSGGYLLARGSDGLLWWDLKNNIRSHVEGAISAEVLAETDCFFTYDLKNRRITLYGSAAQVLARMENVINFATDRRRNLFICRTVDREGSYEIVDFSNGKAVTLGEIKNRPGIMEISRSGRQLIIREKNNSGKQFGVSFINLKSKELHRVENTLMADSETVTVREIGNQYFITFQMVVRDLPLTDIWYGNDGELRKKKYNVSKRHTVWDSETGTLTDLPDFPDTQWTSLNSSRYFANFVNGGTYYNYVDPKPELNLRIYDLQTGTLMPAGLVSTEVYVAPEGNLLLYVNSRKEWEILQLSEMKKTVIGKFPYTKAIFTADGKFVWFESESGLVRYEVRTPHKAPLVIGAGFTAEILNRKADVQMPGTEFFVNTVSKGPMLLSLKDAPNNSVSYLTWNEGRTDPVISWTGDHIKWFRHSANVTDFYAVEENYSQPPRFYAYRKGKKKSLLFDSGAAGLGKGEKIRQDTFTYTNAEGKKLKGLLYYPVGFTPSGRYPMVVSIYQIQSKKGNHYHIPKYSSEIGYDLRTLLQRGYFVFLPDIARDDRGPGIAALDCVHRALDAVAGHPNIDMERVGLTGHSHGGYETNFIATKSRRFKAYISGAGNSDIVRSYFSYNYNFTSPFYWQFETEQYDMRVPFAADKELYLNNSPILNVDQVDAPVLLWAGKQDENIAWDQVMEFYIGLRRNRKPVIALFYDQQGHAFPPLSEESIDLTRRTLEWWDYFLKDKRKIPWIDRQMEAPLLH